MIPNRINSRQILLYSATAVLSVALAIFLFAIGEIIVRATLDIRFFGNSTNLLLSGAYGARNGNTPNTQGVSFGETTFTDAYGFRIPHFRYIYPNTPRGSILFIGDSVAFGPGVAETETFIGQLRKSLPDWAIYNSAVIGADVQDYKAVADALVNRLSVLSQVYLVYCLNDISTASARLLLKGLKGQPTSSANWVESVKKVGFISNANDFLRENSKLYIYLKTVISDPSRRYFLADWNEYRKAPALDGAVQALTEISLAFKDRGVPLTVILAPYEFQMRSGAEAYEDRLLPQRVLLNRLKSIGVHVVDGREWFEKDDTPRSSSYFLYGDPMHFSPQGHQVFFHGIAQMLPSAVTQVK